MNEFEIDGVNYRALKLSAFQQFHVSRRIAPLIPPLIPIGMRMAKELKGDGKEVNDFLNLPELIQPFANALGEMSDEAGEYVIATCLSAIRRQDPATGLWAPVWSPAAKTPLFDDLNDLGKMIPLVVRVIQASLGNFLTELLTTESREASSVT